MDLADYTPNNPLYSNQKCCGLESPGHAKVYIELLLHDEPRRHGTIDVEMYGDSFATINQRAQSMVDGEPMSARLNETAS